MFPTNSTTQIVTPFGSGYVPMHHGEPIRWNDMVEALRASSFNAVLKSLRSALSLR